MVLDIGSRERSTRSSEQHTRSGGRRASQWNCQREIDTIRFAGRDRLPSGTWTKMAFFRLPRGFFMFYTLNAERCTQLRFLFYPRVFSALLVEVMGSIGPRRWLLACRSYHTPIDRMTQIPVGCNDFCLALCGTKWDRFAR